MAQTIPYLVFIEEMSQVRRPETPLAGSFDLPVLQAANSLREIEVRLDALDAWQVSSTDACVRQRELLRVLSRYMQSVVARLETR